MLSRKCIALIIIIMAVITSNSYAAKIRGRVDGGNQYSGAPYPIGNVVVVLYYQSGPNTWQSIARYTTGFDGMYYFNNIDPGAYVIQLNGRQNYPITVSNQPYQDLPPILIRY